MFGRQWRHWKSEEEIKCRDELDELINTPNPVRQSPDFTEVILKSQAMLEKLITSRPFLQQLAEKTCKTLGTENSANYAELDPGAEQEKISACKNVPSDDDTGTFAVSNILI